MFSHDKAHFLEITKTLKNKSTMAVLGLCSFRQLICNIFSVYCFSPPFYVSCEVSFSFCVNVLFSVWWWDVFKLRLH